MALVAATEFSRHIRRLTPFTHDIFACFVCSIYVYDGATDMIARFRGTDAAPTFGEALGECNLAAAVLAVCLCLHRARTPLPLDINALHLTTLVMQKITSFDLLLAGGWDVLPAAVRGLLADYAVTVGVLVSAALAAGLRSSVTIQTIALPNSSH
eukprot:3375696-Prymnesium_polylepis.1